MSYEQYLDEPWEAIQWTLRMAEAHGDAPWQQRDGGGGGGDPRSA